MNDQELLREYAAAGSQPAFRQLVERHLPLVYSAARRRLTDSQLAEDVAQQVFTLLAGKAGRLSRHVVLSGWLYRTACHVASETLRRETRRQQREQLAVTAMNLTDTDATWREIEPLLDDAMASLGETDRDAVVLRFFENKSLRDVGAALGLSDDAAQKRLSRAVEKLRVFFQQRGRSTTGTTLAAAIAAGAIQAVPVGMTATISTAVLSGAALASSALITTKIMSWTTLKPLFATGAALGAATAIIIQTQQVGALRRENHELQARLATAEESATEVGQRLTRIAAAAENDPLKVELAKLRGEVAALRQSQNAMKSENASLRKAVASGGDQPLDAEKLDAEKEAMRDFGLARLNYSKTWGLALMLFAQDHDYQLPETLKQAGSYFAKALPNGDDMSAGEREQFGQLTPEQFELTYRGSLKDIKNPMNTIILREREVWNSGTTPGTVRTYLFADGHSEIHRAPDGNHEAWEKERLPTNQ